MKLEKLDNILIVRTGDRLWRFSGLEKEKSVGESMGQEYAGLSDTLAVILLLAEAIRLGYSGVEKNSKY